jgi:hypothetical protein
MGFKKEERMFRDKIIERTLDAFDLEAILDYNDIPEQAVLESLIENDYMSIDDLLEQLDDEGLSDVEEDDES